MTYFIRGPGAPESNEALGNIYVSNSSIREIQHASRLVHKQWSSYSSALASYWGKESDLRAKEAVLSALHSALVKSHYLGCLLFDLDLDDLGERFDLRQFLAEDRSAFFGQFTGVTIPWHLVYVGSKHLNNNPDFDPEAEAQWLLGIRRPVVHYANSDSSEQDTANAIDSILLSVGTDLPEYGSATAAADHLQDLVGNLPSTPRVERLHSVEDHDAYFRGNQHREFDFWLILSHGGEESGDYLQQTIALEKGNSLKPSDFSVYKDHKFALAKPTCIVMLTCKSGILSTGWDVPIEALNMGASSVIAPHANVTARHSLELLDKLLERFSASDLTPTESFASTLQELEGFPQIHANLFTPLVSTRRVRNAIIRRPTYLESSALTQ